MGNAELTKEQAQHEIEEGILKIGYAIDAVREDGNPLRARQLELHIELVQAAKEYLEGYLHYLEIDGVEYWYMARNPSEPEYA